MKKQCNKKDDWLDWLRLHLPSFLTDLKRDSDGGARHPRLKAYGAAASVSALVGAGVGALASMGLRSCGVNLCPSILLFSGIFTLISLSIL